jgi:hypothetical protein
MARDLDGAWRTAQRALDHAGHRSVRELRLVQLASCSHSPASVIAPFLTIPVVADILMQQLMTQLDVLATPDIADATTPDGMLFYQLSQPSVLPRLASLGIIGDPACSVPYDAAYMVATRADRLVALQLLVDAGRCLFDSELCIHSFPRLRRLALHLDVDLASRLSRVADASVVAALPLVSTLELRSVVMRDGTPHPAELRRFIDFITALPSIERVILRWSPETRERDVSDIRGHYRSLIETPPLTGSLKLEALGRRLDELLMTIRGGPAPCVAPTVTLPVIDLEVAVDDTTKFFCVDKRASALEARRNTVVNRESLDMWRRGADAAELDFLRYLFRRFFGSARIAVRATFSRHFLLDRAIEDAALLATLSATHRPPMPDVDPSIA